ncbi:hypothetical protein A0130_10015 [Leifsonia xyli]|nr:hypothetical protein A0130_10015 [Leifsonia xyli]
MLVVPMRVDWLKSVPSLRCQFSRDLDCVRSKALCEINILVEYGSIVSARSTSGREATLDQLRYVSSRISIVRVLLERVGVRFVRFNPSAGLIEDIGQIAES